VNFDDVRKKTSLPTATVSLCLAGELVEHLEDLERQYAEAGAPENLGDDTKRRLREQIEAKRAEMLDATVDFRLRSMPARQWGLFWANYPVRADGEEEPAYQERLFPFYAEMVSRTVVEPAMSVEEVGEFYDSVGMTTWNALANECMRLNNRKVDIPNSVAVSDLTGPSEQT
jgi:hypothetical protein